MNGFTTQASKWSFREERLWRQAGNLFYYKGGKRMSSFVLGFQDIDKTKRMVVGGKGANLGELSKIEGIRVPDGFCLSTEAFKRIVGETSSMNELLDQLALLKVEDRDKIGELR